MSSSMRPVFYKPSFGNDNFMGSDVVDIAAFTYPASKREDAALTQTKKVSEKI
jgi:hypothetical protein